MNRRSFILTSLGGLIAGTVLPKLETGYAAATAPVVAPRAATVMTEVLRIDGLWRPVTFRALHKGDLFRRKTEDGELIEGTQVWRAVDDPVKPLCGCEPSKIVPEEDFVHTCGLSWSIQAEEADPAHVTALESHATADFPKIKL